MVEALLCIVHLKQQAQHARSVFYGDRAVLDVTLHQTARVEFDSVLRVNVATDATGDYHSTRNDVTLHMTRGTDDHSDGLISRGLYMADEFTIEPFAQGCSEDVRTFASGLVHPYCGVNTGFEAAQWLPEPAAAQSVAMVALRPHTEPQTATLGGTPERDTLPPAIGLLVLASPDPQRYHAGMGTEFLERMGEIASAALSRLR